MKKILIFGLVTGGVVLIIIAGILVYLFIQFGSMMSAFDVGIPAEILPGVPVDMATVTSTIETIPLTEGQQAVMETLGIEPEAIPSLLTPEVEACAVEILGVERVEEIKAGATPTALEIARSSRCAL